MLQNNKTPATSRESNGCSKHGRKFHRRNCSECNASYMRAYLRAQRLSDPRKDLVKRARDRARRAGLPFNLTAADIIVPRRCPALRIPITPGKKRSATSPSLDRIEPSEGYVVGNVRVISDKANRLKADRTLSALQGKSLDPRSAFQSEYRLIAEYVYREQLLKKVRRLSLAGDRASPEWHKIAVFLNRRFAGEPAL